ncbi:MAG: formylglycine-generating enzyme family protein [Crinalium sp.]
MVAGDRHEVTPGFVLPQQGGSVPRSKTYSDPEVERQALTALARDRVGRFLELASPQAQRLVMLLAAAPVITLPIVRLIRDAMLHDIKSPLPIAEVFLSGLLQRLPGQTERELEYVLQESAEAVQIQSQVSISDPPNIADQIPQETQEIVQYDFTPGVRPILLELLPAVDTISVINSVSAAVEQRWKRVSNEDFRAFLVNPDVQVPEGLEGMRAFGSVTADILEQLGGEYVSFAQTLRQRTITSSSLPPKESDSSVAPPQKDEAQFPPPLQTEEFTIISIELQPESKPTQDLELFSFLVATVQHRQSKQQQLQTTEWEILRQQQETYRFREPLPGNPLLEMVAIPGGVFLMGSPEDEPEHQDDEFPQHEVTVEPFFMGAYPITQSQWRVVAELPQVERELDPDPSNFKGANRPVEQISWYDAVEFCARLSALTNRQYRLPTEAEWEYACRARTNTPFHFGETITSELANYDARSKYNGGFKGENRKETTSVEYFGIANAFGLSEMHGNVLEWCQDYRHRNYEDAPTVGTAWTDGGDSSSHILRGGSWSYSAKDCRSAYRSYFEPGYRYRDIGFRVCCSNPRSE